jgi:hypothetical protein
MRSHSPPPRCECFPCGRQLPGTDSRIYIPLYILHLIFILDLSRLLYATSLAGGDNEEGDCSRSARRIGGRHNFRGAERRQVGERPSGMASLCPRKDRVFSLAQPAFRAASACPLRLLVGILSDQPRSHTYVLSVQLRLPDTNTGTGPRGAACVRRFRFAALGS